MDLPHILTADIEAGNAILLLGAGASYDCRDKHGNRPPLGKKLAELIAKRFLGDGYEDTPLDQVSELAISETDILTVQEYVKQIFDPFQPSESHHRLTTFRWRAISTTNYDLVVERAYAKNSDSPQALVPFVSNGENVDRKIRSNNDLQYLKLHGCISRITISDPPLILTTDQYVQYRQYRSRLFSRLKELASDRPIVFVGYTIQDPNIRKLLLELDQDINDGRPRYFSVLPTFTDVEKRFWEQKKITPIVGTFANFIDKIDSAIGSVFRGLSARRGAAESGITTRFSDPDAKLSEPTRSFLKMDVTYVNELNPVACDPKQFYRGMDRGWGAIESNLDVSRRLNETVLEKYVLEQDHRDDVELVLIKGHAGAGKSVLIKRVAWVAAKEIGCLVLAMNETGILFASSVVEIARLCGERLYLFFENILLHQRDVERFVRSLRDAGVKVTIIGGARTNELNSSGGDLEKLATESFDLHYLSEKEIKELLQKLEYHKSLDRLERLSPDERLERLVKRAGRQLLVALHEATLGQPFEKIICDEFNQITPLQAKRVYRTICVLYRLGTPVRAGLLKRVHGIAFEEFNEKFFAPLENVVRTATGRDGEDVSYVARHQHIAEIVFLHALESREVRFEATFDVMSRLDLDYSSDREAFYRLIRGRSILDLFPDRTMSDRIFNLALERSPDDSVVLHQRGIFEMNHPSPNLEAAEGYFHAALNVDGSERIVQHSLSELSLRKAAASVNLHLKTQYLNQAEQMCRQLMKTGASSYERHTLAKIHIQRLKIELELGELSDDDLSEMLQSIERELSSHLAVSPGDEYLLSAESQLAQFLAQTQRAVESLRKAFARNPRSTYIALTLARSLIATDAKEDAEKTLRAALEANPSEKRLHFLLGKLLLDRGDANNEELLHHFRRSYTAGDGNLEAHLLFARQLFLVEGGKVARDTFRELQRIARVEHSERIKLVFPLAETKRGRIVDHQANYAFIELEGSGDRVYAHESRFKDGMWNRTVYGANVLFRIGFSIMGVSAFEIMLDSDV